MKRKPITMGIILVMTLAPASPVLPAQEDPVVLEAQWKLKEMNYDPGPVDGIWGRATEKALKEFQSDAGLEVTGTLDERTKTRLGITSRPKTVR